MHRAPTPRRRYPGYHLMVALLLGGVLFLAACTGDDEPAPIAPMGPTVSSNVEDATPSPAPEPVAPATPDPAPVTPAADPERQVQVEVEEDEPVHAGTDRGIYGPEDCDTANTTTPMTQAEWIANCSDYEAEVPTTPEDEAHTDGGDGWPEGAYEPAPDECIGYGCSPEQDAAINEAEAAANAGY